MTDPELGRVERNDGHTTLRFRRSLSHPPQVVWRALTEAEHMRWWMPVDMIGDRRAGAVVEMLFWPDLVEQKGMEPHAGTATIEVWDPPNVFQWLWHGTRVRFDVTVSPDGCRLDLTVDIETDDPDVIVDSAGGFHLWMAHLTTLLDTGATPPLAEADAPPLEAYYRALGDDG